jgi:hypothetical protein
MGGKKMRSGTTGSHFLPYIFLPPRRSGISLSGVRTWERCGDCGEDPSRGPWILSVHGLRNQAHGPGEFPQARTGRAD